MAVIMYLPAIEYEVDIEVRAPLADHAALDLDPGVGPDWIRRVPNKEFCGDPALPQQSRRRSGPLKTLDCSKAESGSYLHRVCHRLHIGAAVRRSEWCCADQPVQVVKASTHDHGDPCQFDMRRDPHRKEELPSRCRSPIVKVTDMNYLHEHKNVV
jgi:hypothetical protein